MAGHQCPEGANGTTMTPCAWFDSCRRGPRGVAVDFGPEPSGWLINQLGNPSFNHYIRVSRWLKGGALFLWSGHVHV